jgi:CRISPR-associated protein Cas2
METKHFVVVVYDISDNKRRTRLHKKLLNFGTPVQYSVFECLVTKSDYNMMKQQVVRTTKKKLDHIRFYTICEGCKKKVEIIGRSELSQIKEVIVV